MQKLMRLLNVKTVIALLIIIAVSAYFIFPKVKGGSDNKNEYVKADQSIAVLPFVNMSKDSNQEYFSEGLTDGIHNSLAHLNGLKVCARTSSFQFKKKNSPMKEVGRELGVRTILEGSVQIDGDRIIITANLVNVDDSVSLWSAKYDENMDDIFGLQDKIVNAIAEKLAITILQNGDHAEAKKPTASTDAYKLYLKGRSSWNLGTPPDLKKGIDFFQQAIAIDSSYAAAYAGIADCYTALGYGSFIAPKEAFPKALEAATKSIKLDSTLAEPHASLGYYNFYYEWDWAAAEQEFRNAIALNPNYELGYDWYGYYLTAMKRYDEAKVILEKAKELDPLSVRITTDIGFSLYYSGNYDFAVKQLNASLQMNPMFPLTRLWLGRSYQAKKKYPEAIAEYKKALGSSPEWTVALAAIGNVYGESGDKVNAQKILDTLNSLSTRKFVTSYGVALVYLALDERDQAFLWLNNAYNERSNWLVWLKTDPRWATLIADKRYVELVNKVGLPQ
jgi:TolB-like protein/Tfp pilus assembly protein PilF